MNKYVHSSAKIGGAVKKAIIPVAGFGTRFLPATKVSAKEMFTVIDKPVVQYLVEEAVASGIEEILFITNTSQSAVMAHFSRNDALEKFLHERKKQNFIDKISSLHKQAHFMYIHQDEPLGSGGAIMLGKSFIDNEPFAVFYADDLIVAPHGKPALRQLIMAYQKYNTSIMGLVDVPRKEISKYGVIDGKRITKNVYLVNNIVEKPSSSKAPSTMASVGRFIFTPDIFEKIKKVKKTGGEILLTDAIAMIAREGSMHGQVIDGTWYDCGSKLGFWKANLELGLAHPEIGKEAKKYLKDKKL